MKTKVCNKCNIEKDLSSFRLDRGYYLNTCKKCLRKEYREKHREKYLAGCKRYYYRHRELKPIIKKQLSDYPTRECRCGCGGLIMPKKAKTYNSVYYPRYIEGHKKYSNCLTCGKPNPGQKWYCSAKCKNKSRTIKNKDRRQAKNKIKESFCPVCKNTFDATVPNDKSGRYKYCRDCAIDVKRKHWAIYNEKRILLNREKAIKERGTNNVNKKYLTEEQRLERDRINREKANARSRARNQIIKDKDHYFIRQFCKHNNLPLSVVTPELLEAYKLYIQLKRIKNENKQRI